MKNQIVIRLRRIFFTRRFLVKENGFAFFSCLILFFTGLFIWSPCQSVNTSWVKLYHGPSDGVDYVTAMKLDNAGNVYVTGYSWGGVTKEDFLTMRYNRAGDSLWTKRYDGANEMDKPTAMVLDRNGNIYVTGYGRFGSYYEYITIKYLSTGDTAWVRRFAMPSSNQYPSGITVDNSGNVYVAGVKSGGTSFDDYLTIKYYSSGDTAWARVYDGPGSDYDSAAAVVVDNSGNVYVTGYSMQNSMEDYLTIKYNALGDTVWTRRYTRASGSEDEALAMTLDNSGNLLVTGYSERGAGDFDFLTIKYNQFGDTLWMRRFHRPSGYDDIATSIMVDNLNNVYVTGISDQTVGTGNDYLTIKYDSYGNQQWTAYYDGNDSYDEPKALALDAAANVYVTGRSYHTGSNYDYATVKYNANGDEQWSVRYDSLTTGNDGACAIALDDSGKIYVAGSVDQGAGNFDYGTIKYNQVNDVGVVLILTPDDGDIFDCYSSFAPEVRVANYGGNNNPLSVWFKLYRRGTEVYSQTVSLTLDPGEDYDVTFEGIFVSISDTYTFRAYTVMPGDENPVNDTQSGWFYVNPSTPQAWLPMEDVKGGISTKPVKSGGCLVSVRGTYIYALKGNNTNEFYQYFINGDSWVVRCTIPYAPEKNKRVKKGAALCYDSRDTMIYALKGNNTAEFWAYDPNLDTWRQKRNVPELPSGKKIKGGSGLAFRRVGGPNDDRYVYCLKGSKTREFWKYHINGDSWIQLPDLPLGSSQKYGKDGGCITRAGNYIYALKGYYNEFYAYDLDQDTWLTVDSLTFYGIAEKKRKAKEGAALAYDAAREVIYALKGGNCNEFWAYFPSLDTWIELPSMPEIPSYRRIKGGGALAVTGGNAYAFKGNRTLEFWMFTWDSTEVLEAHPGIASGRIAIENSVADKSILTISPNPVMGRVNISYRLNSPTPFELKLYDVSGRCVKSLIRGSKDAGTYFINLELKNLAAGVYVLSLEQSGCLRHSSALPQAVRKFIIMK